MKKYSAERTYNTLHTVAITNTSTIITTLTQWQYSSTSTGLCLVLGYIIFVILTFVTKRIFSKQGITWVLLYTLSTLPVEHNVVFTSIFCEQKPGVDLVPLSNLVAHAANLSMAEQQSNVSLPCLLDMSQSMSKIIPNLLKINTILVTSRYFVMSAGWKINGFYWHNSSDCQRYWTQNQYECFLCGCWSRTRPTPALLLITGWLLTLVTCAGPSRLVTVVTTHTADTYRPVLAPLILWC